jgi:hypothetical protein
VDPKEFAAFTCMRRFCKNHLVEPSRRIGQNSCLRCSISSVVLVILCTMRMIQRIRLRSDVGGSLVLNVISI